MSKKRNRAEDLAERAAIMEFDANVKRELAELKSWKDLYGIDKGYPIDMTMFACPFNSDDKAEVVAMAQDYIARNGLTPDEVKIRNENGLIMVISKMTITKPLVG